MIYHYEFWIAVAIVGVVQFVLIYYFVNRKYERREREWLRCKLGVRIGDVVLKGDFDDHKRQRHWQWCLKQEVRKRYAHLSPGDQIIVNSYSDMWDPNGHCYKPFIEISELLDALHLSIVFVDKGDETIVRESLKDKCFSIVSFLLLSGGALMSIIAFVLVLVMC